MEGALDWLKEQLDNILAAVLQFLPNSPFRVVLPPEVKEILGYINWLIPFDLITKTLQLWCGAILLYYAYMVVMRWAKAIQ